MSNNSGLLIIISGPSGAGKGTIYQKVLERYPHIKRSVSVTTRAPRQGEVEGVHYYFKTLEQYQQMIARGEFLETASVYKNYYGTPKTPVFDMLSRGEDVMFEIDVNGAKQIKAKYPDSVTVFIMPSSYEVLKERLINRGTDSEDSIHTRLKSAKHELSQYKLFDYIVFNDKLEQATEEVIAVINAERRKMERNISKINELLK